MYEQLLSTRSPKAKKSQVVSLLTLSGSAHAKAGCKHVGEIDPWCPFSSILRAALTYEDSKSTKKTDDLTVFFMLSGSAPLKAARRTLMKLISGGAPLYILCNPRARF